MAEGLKAGDRVRVLYGMHIGREVTLKWGPVDDLYGCDDVSTIYYENEITLISPLPKTTADLIAEECDALKALLLAKNKAYSNSALEPTRVFSKASAEEQLLVRIDDKLSRIKGGVVDSEDTIQDLCGYLVLLKIARKK